MAIIAYLRVSSDQQVKTGYGLSSQRLACEEYAQRKGLIIQSFFVDEGISGKLGLEKRPGLKGAIDSLKRNDILLVLGRDRIARKLKLMLDIQDIVERKHAKIITCSGVGEEEQDATGFLNMAMRDVIDHFERMNIGERTRRALFDMKAKGEIYGQIPFGYRKSEDGLHFELDEKEQAIIQEMVTLKNLGVPIREICPILNSKGMFTKYGLPWKKSNLWLVLSRVRTEAGQKCNR
jgi:site-specific DNA recombinase